jgi:hypothetical protein
LVRLRDIGDQLAEQNLSALSAAVAGVAGGVEGLASRLDSVDVDRVLDAGQDTAQRRGPWIFVAAGALFGFAAWATLRRGATDEQEPRGELAQGDDES